MLKALKTWLAAVVALAALLVTGGAVSLGQGCSAHHHLTAEHKAPQQAVAGQPCHGAQPATQASIQDDCDCHGGLCLCDGDKTPVTLQRAGASPEPHGKLIAKLAPPTHASDAPSDLPLFALPPPTTAPPAPGRNAYRAHFARTGRILV